MTTVAWISLAVAFLSAMIIAADEVRRPQKMAIMNIVWPVTALYLSVFALWAYFTIGVKKSKAAMHADSKPKPDHEQHSHHSNDKPNPTPAQVAIAASHCGAGCTLADIGIEFTVAALGLTLFDLDCSCFCSALLSCHSRRESAFVLALALINGPNRSGESCFCSRPKLS